MSGVWGVFNASLRFNRRSTTYSSVIRGVGIVTAATRNGITAQRQYQSIAGERVRFPPDSLPARKRMSRKHGTRNWPTMRGSAVWTATHGKLCNA